MNPAAREKLAARLKFYEDIGIRSFYRDRPTSRASAATPPVPADVSGGRSFSSDIPANQEIRASAPEAKMPILPVIAAPSLFEERIENDSLQRIREDIGDCQRCRLAKKRTNIVFGVGNPRAELMFVGEGPGHDEDIQGEPFVGRAGKLLTQMIEAMGLQRKDVYIANVVKCRPPENRTPEKDEMATCSPFLLRQIAVIQPKVIVALGAVAARALLNTDKSVSAFRGQWFDFGSAKLMPTYHPAYLLRNPPAKVDVWKDLQKVMAFLGLEPPKKAAK